VLLLSHLWLCYGCTTKQVYFDFNLWGLGLVVSLLVSGLLMFDVIIGVIISVIVNGVTLVNLLLCLSPHKLGAGSATGPAAAQPLQEGEYDTNYRDAFGRKAGEKGFVPPLYARAGKSPAEMAEVLPAGFDDHYVDANRHRVGQPDFVPPVQAGAGTSIAFAHYICFFYFYCGKAVKQTS